MPIYHLLYLFVLTGLTSLSLWLLCLINILARSILVAPQLSHGFRDTFLYRSNNAIGQPTLSLKVATAINPFRKILFSWLLKRANAFYQGVASLAYIVEELI